jgi:hypothetical protein
MNVSSEIRRKSCKKNSASTEHARISLHDDDRRQASPAWLKRHRRASGFLDVATMMPL